MSHARTTVCRAPAGERRSLACSRLVCLFVCLLHGAPHPYVGRPHGGAGPSIVWSHTRAYRPLRSARCQRCGPARGAADRTAPRPSRRRRSCRRSSRRCSSRSTRPCRPSRAGRTCQDGYPRGRGRTGTRRTNRTKWEGGVQRMRNQRSEMRRALGGAGRGGAYEDGPMIPWTGVYSLHRPVLTNTDRASGGRIVAYTLRWSYLHGPRSCGRVSRSVFPARRPRRLMLHVERCVLRDARCALPWRRQYVMLRPSPCLKCGGGELSPGAAVAGPSTGAEVGETSLGPVGM